MKSQFHLELYDEIKDDLLDIKKKEKYSSLTALINRILNDYVKDYKEKK